MTTLAVVPCFMSLGCMFYADGSIVGMSIYLETLWPLLLYVFMPYWFKLVNYFKDLQLSEYDVMDEEMYTEIYRRERH